MLLFLVSYLGGVLTILSPCILPVLPFVFARAGRPFVTSTLPLLVGLVASFVGVATFAAVGGSWAIEANHYGRFAAMAILVLSGVTLLFPALAEWLTRPVVSLGARISGSSANPGRDGGSVSPSLVLGLAIGLLWAPCAGPILGLLLTGAALEGASVTTSALLTAYALGAATSMALALLVGGKALVVMRRSLRVSGWIRRGLGVAVIGGVASVALGLDTGFLSTLSFTGTNAVEEALLDGVAAPAGQASHFLSQAEVMPTSAALERGAMPAIDLPVEGTFPGLKGAVAWLNSPPLTAEGLKSKMVLVDFWTYSCINCLHALPYVRAWAQKYKDRGLVVVGVHSPEYAYEKVIGNVERRRVTLGSHTRSRSATIMRSGAPSTIATGPPPTLSTHAAGSVITVSARARTRNRSASSSSCWSKQGSRLCSQPPRQVETLRRPVLRRQAGPSAARRTVLLT